VSNSQSPVSVDTSTTARARHLLLQGKLEDGLAIVESASDEGDDVAAFMLAQLLAFQADWVRVRSLCVRLLKQPFLFDPYHEVMQLFALSAISMSDWKEAKKRIAAVRKHLESLLDMSAELNGYAEAFNRIEAFIWSEGKGKPPFRAASPVNYASMTREEYARLCSLSFRTAKTPNLSLTFDQLDHNRQHHYMLWKALYDEDLDKALELYHDQGDDIRIYLGETLQLAQLLMADKQDDYAWQILKPKLLERKPILSHEVVWMELLWDPKTRALMTPERCFELLTSKRSSDLDEPQAVKSGKERDRLTYFCRLAGCLTQEAVAAVEEQIIEEPDNLDLRLKLIGAFSRYDATNLALKKPHIFWLIEKFADSHIIEDLLHYLFLDKRTNAEDFDQLREKWLEAIEFNPNSTRVLLNAALMLGVDDKSLAEEMLIRGQTIEPDNVKFAERLYELNAFQVSQTEGAQRLLHAREALRQISIIEQLGLSSPPASISQLTIVSRRAWFTLEAGDFKDCLALTGEMIELAQAEGFDQAYQLLGKVIRGRLALKQSEVEEAIHYMTSTLKLDPFNHFRVDHPILTLAGELSAAGQKKPVLEYLQLSREQWPGEEARYLEKFVQDIEADQAPYVPAVRL
jgi:hypothetical protein